MQLESIRGRLTANAEAILFLLAEVSEEQARWKPAPESWSILEVINHLGDEEKEDFRTRLDLTLHHPDRDWPGIDPQGWVEQRRYTERDFTESIERFQEERRRSLDWLGGLESPDWDRAHENPVLGRLSAGDLMRSWLAHDLLHIRQLARLHFDYLEILTGADYSPDYARRW
jgi:hypothetical protein